MPHHGPAPTPCTSLLDPLVRLEQERRGDRETERLRGLEVDHQLKPHQLLDREVRRHTSFQDFVHLDGEVGDVFPLLPLVGKQATRLGKAPAVADGRQLALGCELPKRREVTTWKVSVFRTRAA
jgi:hypothetical protein